MVRFVFIQKYSWPSIHSLAFAGSSNAFCSINWMVASRKVVFSSRSKYGGSLVVSVLLVALVQGIRSLPNVNWVFRGVKRLAIGPYVHVYAVRLRRLTKVLVQHRLHGRKQVLLQRVFEFSLFGKGRLASLHWSSLRHLAFSSVACQFGVLIF